MTETMMDENFPVPKTIITTTNDRKRYDMFKEDDIERKIRTQ